MYSNSQCIPTEIMSNYRSMFDKINEISQFVNDMSKQTGRRNDPNGKYTDVDGKINLLYQEYFQMQTVFPNDDEVAMNRFLRQRNLSKIYFDVLTTAHIDRDALKQWMGRSVYDLTESISDVTGDIREQCERQIDLIEKDIDTEKYRSMERHLDQFYKNVVTLDDPALTIKILTEMMCIVVLDSYLETYTVMSNLTIKECFDKFNASMIAQKQLLSRSMYDNEPTIMYGNRYNEMGANYSESDDEADVESDDEAEIPYEHVEYEAVEYEPVEDDESDDDNTHDIYDEIFNHIISSYDDKDVEMVARAA